MIMKKIPKKGFAHINKLLWIKQKPSIDSEYVGILKKGHTIEYEDVEQNKFGVWI